MLILNSSPKIGEVPVRAEEYEKPFKTHPLVASTPPNPL